MRRRSSLLALAGLLLASSLSNRAFAEDTTDTADTAEPGEASPPVPKPPVAPVGEPAAPAAPASAEAPAKVPAKPKVGDTTVTGYFRGGFGASNLKGRMVCFSLSNPAGLVSKYRLGNECEVWAESHFTTVAYSGDDGVVASMHFMPTVYIPTTYIGHSPTSSTSVPDLGFTTTGATVSFPNLYVDLKGVPWLFGGTAWVGSRYYKRESVYISDFFYWNPSGVGGGIEDVHLGRDLRLSYGIFPVDGEPVTAGMGAPALPARTDLGLRNDIQLRGIKFWQSGEFQVGLQGIADYSNHKDANGNSVTHGGWGATVQFVQQVLGGENKLAVQYGRGGGTGFGTLARFYYPDFSIYFAPAEFRVRVVDVLTIQPHPWFGTQAAIVYQHDDLGVQGQKTDWYSAGTRLSFAPLRHAKLLTEVGYDQIKKNNGSNPQYLIKFTPALAITADQGFWARPELRLFWTYAQWNSTARTATIDSGRLYTTTNYLSGSSFGLQAETWW